MGRKKSDDLRQDLLNAALELFQEKGFDDTSVSAILKKVGASKGAFYHYFQSKDDILETITNQYISTILKIPEKIAQDTSYNGIEKMNKLIADLLEFKSESRDMRLKIIGMFEMEGNLKLKEKIIENTKLSIKEPYRKIIEQGIQEGIFMNDFPDEVAELWINMIINMNSSISKLILMETERSEIIKAIERKSLFYQDTMERILGLSKGAFKFSNYVSQKLTSVYMKD